MILAPHEKLLWHGARVQQWLVTKKTYPVLIEISPTGYCNASCSFCFFKDKRGSEIINTNVLLEAICDMADNGVKAINWTGGGEPTLHPDFELFVKTSALKGIRQGLFTNGYREIPYPEAFDWIRITLTERGFSHIKKPSVPFGICMNQTKETKRELREACLQAKDFGARYFQVRPALNGHHEEQDMLVPPSYLEQYATDNFSVYVTPYKYEDCTKPHGYDKCYGYHFCPSIDWNGNILVCMYMTGNDPFILGSLRDGFDSVWKKIPEYVEVVEDCQNCCKNHEINKVLYRCTQAEQVEFI